MWNKDEIDLRDFYEWDQIRKLVEFENEGDGVFKVDCWRRSDDY